MQDCLFCKIIAGDIPSTKVYEDDMMLAFRDIDPQAPEHIVIVPKCHIASANDINETNVKYVSHIWEKIPEIAKTLGIDEKGYRVVNNCGKDGGTDCCPSAFPSYGAEESSAGLQVNIAHLCHIMLF